jgi:hypothetical protein
MIEKIYHINERLPDPGQKVLCFGYKTICCELDMEPEAEWHEVTFRFVVNSYKLKKEIPKDLDESILEFCTVSEDWDLGEYADGSHLIGVTKWKRLESGT